MIIKCLACRQEMMLNPANYQNREGPIRCFACGAMIEAGKGRDVAAKAEAVQRRGSPAGRRDDWRGSRRRSQEGWGGPRKPVRK